MLDEATHTEPELALETEQSVTALELFFDLVFVFALTQVTGFLYRDPTWLRLVEALALLMALWFAWTAYAWLGNTAGTGEGDPPGGRPPGRGRSGTGARAGGVLDRGADDRLRRADPDRHRELDRPGG